MGEEPIVAELRGSGKLSHSTRAYMAERMRHRLHSHVLNLFKESGMTVADLARRMGRRPATVRRLLCTPHGWGIETYSDALAAFGRELTAESRVP